MKRDFESVLDNCLRILRAGGDVATCLDRYPAYADELRPLLQLAIDLSSHSAPLPAESARHAARQRMLASVEKRQAGVLQETFLSRVAHRLAGRNVRGNGGDVRLVHRFAAMAAAVLILLTSGVTVGASRSSLPGDALYPVKTTAQRARMVFTLDKVKRDALLKQVDDERRQDIRSAMLDDREAKVEFAGVLQQVGGGIWIVGGLPVTLDHDTLIQGEPLIGAQITVRGRLPGDGTLVAIRLTVEEGGGVLLSPLPTPGGTQEPAATKELDGDETPEPAEAEELGIDDEGTPEPVEAEEPVDEGTPEPAETVVPDDGGTADPVETEEVEEDQDQDEMPTPSETEEPDDDETPESTEEPDDGEETPEHDDDDDRTPEPTRTEEPDDGDETTDPTKEPEE